MRSFTVSRRFIISGAAVVATNAYFCPSNAWADLGLAVIKPVKISLDQATFRVGEPVEGTFQLETFDGEGFEGDLVLSIFNTRFIEDEVRKHWELSTSPAGSEFRFAKPFAPSPRIQGLKILTLKARSEQISTSFRAV